MNAIYIYLLLHATIIPNTITIPDFYVVRSNGRRIRRNYGKLHNESRIYENHGIK